MPHTTLGPVKVTMHHSRLETLLVNHSLLAHFAALTKFRVSGYRPWALRYAEENKAEIQERVFPNPEAL